MKLLLWHRDRLCREAVRRALSGSVWSGSLTVIEDVAGLRRAADGRHRSVLLVELDLAGPRAEALATWSAHANVVVLCKSASEAGAYEAMGRGALGLIAPPALLDNGDLVGGGRFLQRLERLLMAASQDAEPAVRIGTTGDDVPLIALGASTGGPLALSRVIRSLPPTLAAAVVVVQHIESEFSLGFAEWLATHSALPVRVPVAGEAPQCGTLYVAGPSGHLELTAAKQFAVRPSKGMELHVPSVDSLFLSLAQHARPAVAALLTGMGQDGVEGLLQMRRRGWFTVAQDEASSVVYGMPRVAVERDAAEQVLPLDAIAAALLKRLPIRPGAV